MKLLVALDGSSFGESILPVASDLAARLKADVTLLSVASEAGVHATWTRPPSATPSGDMIDQSNVEARGLAETTVQAAERILNDAREYLNGVAQGHFPNGANVQALMGDSISEEIIRFARAQQVDLIAMATHGRTGVTRLVMGSVVSEVIRANAAPVVVVRPK